MKIKVPDYYKDFTCKCGECRHSCCMGWRVTVSQDEYFRLLGMDCTPDVRHRIDCALLILKNPSPDRFAEIKHNYLGRCPLQRDDGLCTLQRDCGEEALPAVCRLYPRNIIYCTMGKGACANSCEKTVELLVAKKDSLNVEETDSPYAVIVDVPEEERDLQRKTFKLLCDRELTLEERLVELGKALGIEPGDKESYSEEEIFKFLLDLVSDIEKYSPTFEEYSIIAEEEINILSTNIDMKYVKERYEKAKKTFAVHYPDYEVRFENIMNNHLFYERFPYSDKKESLLSKYATVCGIFILLKFITVAYTENKPTDEDFVDCVAGLFRCFEHSDCGRVINGRLARLGRLTYPFIAEAVSKL